MLIVIVILNTFFLHFTYQYVCLSFTIVPFVCGVCCQRVRNIGDV